MKEELQRIREGRGRSKDKYCVFSCVKHMCKYVFVCMEAGRGLWGRGKGPWDRRQSIMMQLNMTKVQLYIYKNVKELLCVLALKKKKVPDI